MQQVLKTHLKKTHLQFIVLQTDTNVACAICDLCGQILAEGTGVPTFDVTRTKKSFLE